MATSKLELAVGTGKWEAGLKKAQSALKSFTDSQGGLTQALDKDSEKMSQFVRMMGNMTSNAATAKGKMNEYKRVLEQMTHDYKQMNDAQKKTIGQDYLQAIDKLKEKFKQAKLEVDDFNKSLGNDGGKFSGIIDNIGSKLGVTGNLTEMLTSKTALLTGVIGAGTTAVTAAAKAWASYNSELAKQDQMTSVITGLKGENADKMTNAIRAMADTYGVDFRQAVEAANTLMAQFGETSENTLQILRDGMQGMIIGDGNKLLQMIQQYAPAFRDAGVSASQLVAVIQNSEGGIFTAENMNAIVMGIKNIRLMTKATSDALAQAGIDGQRMAEQLSNGTLTIFDALKQVSTELQKIDSNSQTAGQVMQAVFGRQGTMAGTNLAKAIAQLNTNLEETKKQTGDVGKAYADLEKANERLNAVMRETFGMNGWEEMSISIKSSMVEALDSVLTRLLAVKLTLQAIFGSKTNANADAGVQIGGSVGAIGAGATSIHPNLLPEVVIKPGVKTTNNTKGGGGGGNSAIYPTGSEAALNQRIAQLRQLQSLATTIEGRNGIQKQIDEITFSLKQLKGEISAEDDLGPVRGTGIGAMGIIASEKYRKGVVGAGLKQIDNFKGVDISGKKADKDAAKVMSDITGGIGNIVSGIQQMGVEIPGELQNVLGVLQGMSTIMTGIMALVTLINGKQTAQTFLQIIPGYARGGMIPHAATGFMVPGNDHADRTLVAAQSGELILNRAQQGNLSSQLTGSAGGAVNAQPYVMGEQILLGMKNTLKRMGKGEIVTTKR